jgi:predicted DNA-binding transcriptional regulator AlpA
MPLEIAAPPPAGQGHPLAAGLPATMNAAQAAQLLQLSPATLSTMRCRGYGPPYRKAGSRVVYLRDEVIAWLDACPTPR